MKRIFTHRSVDPVADQFLLWKFKLRESDKVELETVWKLHANTVLIMSSTKFTQIGFCNGVPFVIWGVEETDDPDVGLIWAVGTDLIAKGGIDLLRWSRRRIIEPSTQQYGKLYNYMDSRNDVHRRYVEATGFKFTGETIVRNGHPFEYFELIRGI